MPFNIYKIDCNEENSETTRETGNWKLVDPHIPALPTNKL
jgi:hypothetical protein